MGKVADNFQLNLAILTQCREQLNLSIEDVKKQINAIEDIENGHKRPTYKQLSTLSDLYQVPRWVFISETLPEEYQYKKEEVFRTFKKSQVFQVSKIPQLITRVKKYRDLLIDLRKDLDDPIQPFKNPFTKDSIDEKSDISRTATKTREWLGIESEPLNFSQLKDKLEQIGIFVFLTSKYKGWSHIDTAFRGLAINDPTMPIIIINHSDSKKAHSFTLMHELGHILREDMGIDGVGMADSKTEKWCDQFAGEILMPASSPIWESSIIQELSDVEKLARQFQVSPYACLVRLRQLAKISQQDYSKYENKLNEQYESLRKKLKETDGGPARNRSREVKEQFGNHFVGTVLTAWHNQEITLHKVAKLFDLKHPQHVFDLEGLL